MHSPSDEQKKIIENLDNYNIIVDSVAGCGKTTTALHIAKRFSDKNILLATYNKKLRMDTAKRIKEADITNMEVHTYHSYCNRYYSTCRTDSNIIEILKKNIKSKNKTKYDIYILDEVQDMTPIYFRLIHKILNKDAKICILGDRYQCIYQFNSADFRFIKYATILFNVNSFNWLEEKLSTTYRLTKGMTNFLNICVLKTDRLKSNKDGTKPRYIICDIFGDSDIHLLNEVFMYLETYNNEDIFILTPSVKSDKSPARILANKLSELGIKIYVPNSDEEKLDDDILKGKLVFSTFHQAKGLERKVVIVLGIDNGYFNFFGKDIKDTHICPNTIYVALTRASEKLSIFHHFTNNYIDFLDASELPKYCDMRKMKLKISKFSNKIKDISVTEIVRHLSSEVVINAKSYLKIEQINDKKDKINIPIKINEGEYFEAVSEINGTAIPAYYELITTGRMKIFDVIKSNYVCENTEYMFDDVEIEDNLNISKMKLEKLDIEQLLFIANSYCSFISGYNYKMRQISNYDWLSKENLIKSVDRLKFISNKAVFEKKVEMNTDKIFKILNGRKIVGYIDCIDENDVYEFKCVDELSDVHFIQLAIYSYLHQINEKGNKNYYLYNILTDEKFRISCEPENLREMIDYVLNSKYDCQFINDDKFIEEMCDLIKN